MNREAHTPALYIKRECCHHHISLTWYNVKIWMNVRTITRMVFLSNLVDYSDTITIAILLSFVIVELLLTCHDHSSHQENVWQHLYWNVPKCMIVTLELTSMTLESQCWYWQDVIVFANGARKRKGDDMCVDWVYIIKGIDERSSWPGCRIED